MQFDADRAKDPGAEPSIAAMTEFAVSQLAAKGTGYLLLVEAGAHRPCPPYFQRLQSTRRHCGSCRCGAMDNR